MVLSRDEENIFRRIPEFVRPVVEDALANYPALVSDINNIIATHSCSAKRAPELAEHIISLVAAEQMQDNSLRRANLRMEAFKGSPIDADIRKDFIISTVAEVRYLKDGYCKITMENGFSFLEKVSDGYLPQVGDIVWQYTICFSVVLGCVIGGHVFRYKTLSQEEEDCKLEQERR